MNKKETNAEEMSLRISQMFSNMDNISNVEQSNMFKQSMGGGEILRMILADSKSYMQAKEGGQGTQDRQRPQTSAKEGPDVPKRNKPRDISELD